MEVAAALKIKPGTVALQPAPAATVNDDGQPITGTVLSYTKIRVTHVEKLPALSVTRRVTSFAAVLFVAMAEQVSVLGATVMLTIPQLSVDPLFTKPTGIIASSSNGSTATETGPDAQLATGAWFSNTVTVTFTTLWLPVASRKIYGITVVPIGKLAAIGVVKCNDVPER